ncbi:MAG TPA: 16S rRNA (uracil(1498)-N(3))-methyltransferase [Desulfuromonadales bacterium]|nr:16S rRNA (uracil(1498)-N(3))-methyltransferase [Desulfuromonadales bacterium]
MTLRRFMVGSVVVCNATTTIEGDLFNHIIRVLRLGKGEKIQLVDGNGTTHTGIIDRISVHSLDVSIVSTEVVSTENQGAPRITVCQALPKGDKIDLVLQKGTELGAHDFRLFCGQRSVARLPADRQQNKLDRWNRITSEAARQCGRHDVPTVTWSPDAQHAAYDSGNALRLILWECERELTLKTALSTATTPSSVIVAVGPEGGFSCEEVECFHGCGFMPVSLGSRILRTETAALAILAIMQYMWDGL